MARKPLPTSLSPERLQSLQSIQDSTNTRFHNLSLLDQAFTHRSYSNEGGKSYPDNERLEFLGDAVLGLLVAEHLFLNLPRDAEGLLANRKSKIVSAPALARLSENYSFTKYLLVGKGEIHTAKKNLNVQADTFEAFLGALYRDQGLESCKNFLEKHIEEISASLESFEETKDYKTTLQEYCQKLWKSVPIYTVEKEEGLDHDKTFTIRVEHGEHFSEIGTGKNKKLAEQSAAKKALGFLKIP